MGVIRVSKFLMQDPALPEEVRSRFSDKLAVLFINENPPLKTVKLPPTLHHMHTGCNDVVPKPTTDASTLFSVTSIIFLVMFIILCILALACEMSPVWPNGYLCLFRNDGPNRKETVLDEKDGTASNDAHNVRESAALLPNGQYDDDDDEAYETDDEWTSRRGQDFGYGRALGH